MSQKIENYSKSSGGKYLTEFQRKLLQKSLLEEDSALYQQRIKIMLLADEGLTKTAICQQLGCCIATVRLWVMMVSMGEVHNWKINPLGRPKAVTYEYLIRLKELVQKSPKDVNVPHKNYTYNTNRWTAQKLSEHLKAEFDIDLSDRHINRLLKKMNLSTREKNQKLSSEYVVINDLNSENWCWKIS